MKKILSSVLAVCMICGFSSCGKDTAEEVTEESPVIQEETTEEETTTEEIYEEDYENEEIPDNYIDIIEKFERCRINGDRRGVFELSRQTEYIEYLNILADIDNINPDDYIGNTVTPQNDIVDFRIDKINNVDLYDKTYSYYHEKCEFYHWFMNYAKKIGIENITAEILDEKTDEWDTIDDTSIYDPIIKIANIDYDITYIYNDGIERQYHEFIKMCYFKGDGWKVNIDKEQGIYKHYSPKQITNTIYRASKASIVDLDEESVSIPEKFIISSDKNKNYNTSDEFSEIFYDKIRTFYNDIVKYNYFIVIDNGICTYAVLNKNDKVYVYHDDDTYESDVSYEEVHNKCFDEINSDLSGDEEGYTEVIERYIQCVSNDDKRGVIECCYTKDTIELMNILSGMDGVDILDYLDSQLSDDIVGYRFDGVESVEALDEEYLSYMNNNLNSVRSLMAYIDETGVENITRDGISDKFSQLDNEDLSDPVITKGYEVYLNLTQINADGTEETGVCDAEVYYVDGEGWLLLEEEPCDYEFEFN